MNLRILNVRSTELEELPDLSMASNLEIVSLNGCRNLRSVHSSILSLPKLVSLDLSWCCRLRSLQSENHRSQSLKHLELLGCNGLKELWLSSAEMRVLNLRTTSIKMLILPNGGFNKLEELYLGSTLLRSFQINECCLTSLKILSFHGMKEEIMKGNYACCLMAYVL